MSLVFINAHGQIGSRDLNAEYCATNWARDPVKCAAYVPDDYEQRKSEYQAQEAEKVKQEIAKSKEAQNSQRFCPSGSHIGKDSFGNDACVDSKTNQIIGRPNIDKNNNINGAAIGVGLLFFIIIALVIVAIKRRGSRGSYQQSDSVSYGTGIRRGWTEIQKEEVRIRQGGKCNECGRPPPRWEYHHRDGNRSNNSMSNCEGLCPNCHSVRTHDG